MPFDHMSIYIDGSTYNGRWKDIARSGWGLVVTDCHLKTSPEGERICGVEPVIFGSHWGHLPGRVQCNYRAEVYALLLALTLLLDRNAVDCLVFIVTDCKGVLGGWHKGDERHFMEGS